jgi:hypothetical protein
MLLAPWLFAIQLTAPSDVFDVRQVSDDPCVMNAFAQLLERGEGILGKVEAAAFLVRDDDGSLSMVLWPRTEFSRKETFRGAIPLGTVAIVHTHPPRWIARRGATSPKQNDWACRSTSQLLASLGCRSVNRNRDSDRGAQFMAEES